ncbi:hypothetical protein LTR16_000900 [Cryomyces antarcticus]|uniref:Uncharacterized protein n=1 Tax=Cryomyces antarcticus TaxID=329879 RepID=A0ABR0KW71_9PEZI|nr:hypothetical protein LTR39_000614 [Cryomyces antarcticus]KAK5020543.1 hypothetical protein LTR60_000422 [Cryomyces antarcticus]KAK5131282.1 hypothetical protein LTR16_000900 [Cryomyces antarcticus]
MTGPPWRRYERLYGYYSGLRNLVPISGLLPEQSPASISSSHKTIEWTANPSGHFPIELNPYSHHNSREYLGKYHPVRQCFLDASNERSPPRIYGYLGVPQHHPEPLRGSYHLLGLQDDICFDRFGRLGPYGFGYERDLGGTGEGLRVEREGSEDIWALMGSRIDWRSVNWGEAQHKCYLVNRDRFRHHNTSDFDGTSTSADVLQTVPRSAVVLRTWVGFAYTPEVIMHMRAMINELALGSGGEYGVHLLVHVKDDTLPFWESKQLYERIRASVPDEFRGLVTLWSEKQMKMIYPGPFSNNIKNRSRKPTHHVFRSAHMPLQYFAINHPEYDYFWNWEMDIRYIGHYYELFDGLGHWARRQRRKWLWERNAKYYNKALYGDWEQFSEIVRQENEAAGNRPVWGPVAFPNASLVQEQYGVRPPGKVEKEAHELWGVGEEADLITLNPIFDPDGSGWVFEKDVTGYDLEVPIPPRRAAIITAGRLSRRLLNVMHEENLRLKHTMFTEMWPPSCALHYGLKAVYAPHPVYFDRKWPLDDFENIFNGGRYGSSGGNASSVFHCAHEHNQQGSSWYYNSRFAGPLWRRWLGHTENGEGGAEEEKEDSGRMCLRSMLLHPIKY